MRIWSKGDDGKVKQSNDVSSDADASNDWQVSVGPGEIRWETDTYDANPDADALEFGHTWPWFSLTKRPGL